MNPTQDVLEQRLAALEGGVGALALASGQAAVTYSILTIAGVGDNIVASNALYGGTYNLFAHTLPQYGITVRFADYRRPDAFERLIDEKTKAVFVESLGNPQGNVTDFERVAAGQFERAASYTKLKSCLSFVHDVVAPIGRGASGLMLFI